MQDNMMSQAVKVLTEQKRRKRWHRVVSLMAAVVVFVTTYALILPAITMEQPKEYKLTAVTPEGVTVILTGPAQSFSAPLNELSLSVTELTGTAQDTPGTSTEEKQVPDESASTASNEPDGSGDETQAPDGSGSTTSNAPDGSGDETQAPDGSGSTTSNAPDGSGDETQAPDESASNTSEISNVPGDGKQAQDESASKTSDAPKKPDHAALAIETLDTTLQESEIYPLETRLFDIRLWQGEKEVEPVGPVSLTFTGIAASEIAEKAIVYHIDAEKEQATDMPALLQEDGSVAVETDHFSLYGVALMAAGAEDDDPVVDVSVNVVWSGGAPPSGATVQLELRRNGTAYSTITLPTSGNAWNTTLNNLPVGVYTLVQTGAPAGFSGTVEKITQPDNTQAFTVTNTALLTGDMTVGVQKTWDDTTPGASSVTFALMANGNRFMPDQTVTVNAAGNWQGSFNNLPETDAQGNTISYSVYEMPVTGWTPSVAVTDTSRKAAAWENVPTSTTALTNGTVYRFVTGTGTSARALAYSGSGNSLTPATLSDTSTTQQWEWVSSGSYLRNVSNPSRRIYINGTSITAPTTSATSLTQTWSNGTVRFYGAYRHITMSTTTVGTTTRTSRATYFTPQTLGSAVLPRRDISVINHKVGDLESAEILSPHEKKIDSLADGVINPDTTLSGTDFYRLYLDNRTKGYPVDIVLVVDRSGSMEYLTTTNATGSGLRRDQAVGNMLNGIDGQEGFIHRFLSLNEQNNLSIVWFGGDWYGNGGMSGDSSNDAYYNTRMESGVVKGWTQDKNHKVTVNSTATTDNNNTTNNITYRPANGTNYMAGMWEAADMLRSDSAIANNGHKKMVVFLTDGSPSYYVKPTQASSAGTAATYEQYLTWKNGGKPNTLYRTGTGSTTGTNDRTATNSSFNNFKTENPNVIFSSVMFAPSDQDTAVLSNMVNNGGSMVHTQGDDSLNEVFANLIANMTFSKNVTLQDNLSKYVAWYEPQPDLKIVRTNLLTGVQDVLWQSTGPATSGTIGAPTGKNMVVQDGVTLPVIESVTYNPSISVNSTGMVQVVFSQEFKLDINNKYTLSFNVKTTPTAYLEFTDNLLGGDSTGYIGVSGDSDTDYTTNTSSSNKPGFYANQSATLKYLYDGKFYESPYDHPVIQVSGFELLLRKTDTTGQTLLPGARFNIYQKSTQGTQGAVLIPGGDGEYGVKKNTVSLITGSNGTLRFGKLQPGDYYLVEVQAPIGYQLPTSAISFSLQSSGLTILTHGDKASAEGQTENGAFILQVKNDSDVILSSITAQKEWRNPDGTEKTSGLPSSVDVRLWRRWETVEGGGSGGESHTVTFYVKAKTSSGTVNVPVDSREVAAGGEINFYGYIWEAPTTVTANGTALTSTGTIVPNGWLTVPTYRINNITADQSVVFDFGTADLWENNISEAFTLTVSSYTAPSGGGGGGGTPTLHTELVQTVTLNAANDWKYGWDTLPADDGNGNQYFYYVEEIDSPPGFKVSYDNNDGVTNGVITIINQTVFILPETGGIGTIPYIMAGILLMVGAGLMYKKKLFRKGGLDSS